MQGSTIALRITPFRTGGVILVDALFFAARSSPSSLHVLAPSFLLGWTLAWTFIVRPYSNDLSNLWVTPRAWIVARVSCFELLRRGRMWEVGAPRAPARRGRH